MGLRKITYASMQGNEGSQSIFSSAAVWGALKLENADIGAKAVGMKAFIRETRTELTSDSQQLPEGEFSMYFIVEKNNSGNNEDVWAEIDAFIATLVVN